MPAWEANFSLATGGVRWLTGIEVSSPPWTLDAQWPRGIGWEGGGVFLFALAEHRQSVSKLVSKLRRPYDFSDWAGGDLA